MNRLVSVIVPVYKVEDYLHRCVDSILSQTYRFIEIILVDDGSPDRCGEICDEYAAMDERITVLHQHNQGLSSARNAGLTAARGVFVTFVDSDDWVHPAFVQELVRLIDERDADISICKTLWTKQEDVVISDSQSDVSVYTNVEALRQFLRPPNVTMVITCAKLYRRDLFSDIRFPEGRCHEDEFTTHRVIWNAKKIALTSAQLYYYWQRDGSIMATRRAPRQRADARDAYRARAEFFRSVGMDPESGMTYQKLFWMYLRDRQEARASGDELEVKRLSEEMRALAILLGDSRQKLPLTIAMYKIAPRLMDIYWEWRLPLPRR